MSTDQNKEILLKGNEAIANGDNEGFLSFCSEDTKWHFIGDKTLTGKAAVRAWMAANYIHPPMVTVFSLVAEGDMLIAVGEVTMQDDHSNKKTAAYCDVWRFQDGKIAELKAFVIDTK